MIYNQKQVPYYQFSHLSRFRELGHFVSTRKGGISPPPQDTLNLSFRNGDRKAHVTENRESLAKVIGISPKHFITANQVHGTQVAIVAQSRKRRTIKTVEFQGPNGASDGLDALVTDVPGMCLMVLSADCVPVLLYDPVARIVGAVHAGWKGTMGTIVQKVVHVFQHTFDSQPDHIHAGIGPSIGPCCFEVGREVLEQYEAILGAEDLMAGKDGSHGYIDLWKANARQLVQVGVPDSHIEHSQLCTCHHVDTFFSYRCEQGKTGRFGTGIFLRSP